MKSKYKDLNLVDYLTGNLEPEERQKVEQALEESAELRQELSLMRREIQLMRTAGHDPHADARIAAVHENVMGRVRESQRAPVVFNSTWLSYFRAVVVVIIIIVALTIFFILRPESPDTATGGQQHPPAEQTETRKPVTLQLTTSNPKIKIQWTLDPEAPQLD
jgi:anti-sigma factor RsiW